MSIYCPKSLDYLLNMSNYSEPKKDFFSKLYELSHWSKLRIGIYQSQNIIQHKYSLRLVEIKLGELKSYWVMTR